MAALLLNGSMSPKAATVETFLKGLLRRAIDEVTGRNAPHFRCCNCSAEVWNDWTFPNHGWCLFTARELGLRRLPRKLRRLNGKCVCIVCRNRLSARHGDGNTV